jgi:hypothetical protein
MNLSPALVQGTIMTGGEKLDLSAGDKVRYQKQIGGGEIEDFLAIQTVPEGKRWEVNSSIYILEYDV